MKKIEDKEFVEVEEVRNKRTKISESDVIQNGQKGIERRNGKGDQDR